MFVFDVPTRAWTDVLGGFAGDVDVEGNLIAAVGALTMSDGSSASVGLFDGNTWSKIPNTPPTLGLETVEVLANGDVLMVENSNPSASTRTLHRFDAATSSWSILASNIDGLVMDILELPGGAIAIAGQFTQVDGTAFPRMAQFENGVWRPINVSITGPVTEIRSLQFLSPMHLVVGGAFTRLDISTDQAISAYTPDDVPANSNLGLTSSCGLTMSSVALPFIGRTSITEVVGTQPGFLIQILGAGYDPVGISVDILLNDEAAGTCPVYVDRDSIDVQATTTATTRFATAIPLAPSLVGALIHQQFVSWNFDRQPQAVTSAIWGIVPGAF